MLINMKADLDMKRCRLLNTHMPENSEKCILKGLSHKVELAIDDMYG